MGRDVEDSRPRKSRMPLEWFVPPVAVEQNNQGIALLGVVVVRDPQRIGLKAAIDLRAVGAEEHAPPTGEGVPALPQRVQIVSYLPHRFQEVLFVQEVPSVEKGPQAVVEIGDRGLHPIDFTRPPFSEFGALPPQALLQSSQPFRQPTTVRGPDRPQPPIGPEHSV